MEKLINFLQIGDRRTGNLNYGGGIYALLICLTLLAVFGTSFGFYNYQPYIVVLVVFGAVSMSILALIAPLVFNNLPISILFRTFSLTIFYFVSIAIFEQEGEPYMVGLAYATMYMLNAAVAFPFKMLCNSLGNIDTIYNDYYSYWELLVKVDEKKFHTNYLDKNKEYIEERQKVLLTNLQKCLEAEDYVQAAKLHEEFNELDKLKTTK